jgi:hypothetical protein
MQEKFTRMRHLIYITVKRQIMDISDKLGWLRKTLRISCYRLKNRSTDEFG